MLTVQTLVQDYQSARDLFNENGGADFMKERQALRSDYCKTEITAIDLREWVDSLPGDVQGEFSRRFAEWDLKIAKGAIKRLEPAELTPANFLLKVDTFYRKYAALLQGELFTRFTETKTQLRDALLDELRESTGAAVAAKYSITDDELVARMTHEWKVLKT